jgi:plastocyanin
MRAMLLVVALLATSCSGADGETTGDGGAVRRVLLDYKHDEFAASFLAYYPNKVTVHPGDRVDFKQAWTGEPHSVTMGRLVDELGQPYWDLLDPVFDRGDGDYSSMIGVEEPKADEFFATLPFLNDERFEVQQAAAQPCYLATGKPDVTDPDRPCAVQEQPEFDGTYAYYNSAFIPYEGERGTTYSVPLADDVPPGTYHYYCNYHFVQMSGVIEVVPKAQPIPSQSDVNRAANLQATRSTKELGTMFADARAGRRGKLPVVGVEATDAEQQQEYGLFPAIGDEFVPSTIEAKPNQKVTWTFVGGSHSIAFKVPKYFPVFDVEDGGKVTVDERGFRAVGFPAPPDEQAFDAAAADPEAPPPSQEPRDPINVDGGRYDGTGGLRSTGMFYAAGDTFSLTFTKPGSYPFACVIHPAMVGKVVVR